MHLETKRATGFSASLLAPYAVDPAFLRQQALRDPKTANYQIDKPKGVAYLDPAEFNWPRIENESSLVLGSSRALNEALQHATTELMRWLMESHGYDERSVSVLMGHGMEYEVANVVDPEFTMVAKIRKRFLGPPL